ncbi:MAG: hypothetical protein ACU0BN_14060 [Sulfitobacter sp.]|uniref:hypothetical protein n=1 Tax=Sulfitobacter sp. TaxID=1903071 RepID=UPI0040587492
MKLFLHVGMGKTGTSSIQNALKSAEGNLQGQGAHYLGMWFDIVDPKYQGIQGVRNMMTSGEDNLVATADAIFSKMQAVKADTGCERFIFSNEDLFGHVVHIGPLIRALAEKVDLTLVLYVRDIQSWLPSAYVQWAIRHKTQPGPIRPFREEALRWIETYRALDVWHREFGEWLVIRKFDKGVDVIDDFGSTTGVDIPKLEKRVLERAEDAEVLLRALYNNRFRHEVFPDRFNRFVINTNRQAVPKLEDVVRTYLDFDGADEAIAPYLDDLKQVADRIGVDFLGGASKSGSTPEVDGLRDRLIDYLIEMNLTQSVQMQQISGRLKALEDKIGDWRPQR